MSSEVPFPRVHPLKVVGFSRSSEVTLDDIFKLVGGSKSIVISIRSLEPISSFDFSTGADPCHNLDWKQASISKCLSSSDDSYLLSLETKDGPETAIVSKDTLTNHWGLCYRSPVLPKLPLAMCTFLANGSWSDELVNDFLRRHHIVNGLDDEELHPSVRHKILAWKLVSEISTNPSLGSFGHPASFLQFLNNRTPQGDNSAHAPSHSSAAAAAPANIVADAADAAAASVLYWPSPVPVLHGNCHSCQLGGNLQPPVVENLCLRPANGTVPSFFDLASGNRWDLGAASTVASLNYHVRYCASASTSSPRLPFFPLDIWHEHRFVPSCEQLKQSETPHACDVGRLAGHNRHVFRLYDAKHSVVVEFVHNASLSTMGNFASHPI